MSTRTRLLPILGLLLCLLYSTGSAAEDEARVAVLDVKGDMSEIVLSVVTDQVRAGALDALSVETHNVMTQESMRALLEDMGVDPDACAEAANCVVDYGKRIGAALVISGTVAEVDGTKMLTLKLFDTERTKLLKTKLVKAKGSEELIDKTSPAAAAMIREGLGLDPPRRSRRAEEDEELGKEGGFYFDERTRHLVSFSSRPEGAAVSLDGSYVCDTPCSRELDGGFYDLEVARARYDRHEENLEITGKRRVSVQLEPQFGWLTVETTPSGLDITIDGKPSGKSPLHRLDLPPGSYRVLIADSRWQPTGKKVSVSKGLEKTVSLQAAPREGGLVVSAVDGAGNALDLPVRIDGEKAGETPLKKKLQIGEYTVVVGDKTHRVQIRENEVEKLEVIEKQASSVYATPNTGRDNAGKNPHMWQSVSAGGFHTCGVTSSSKVECWGGDDGSEHDYGQSTPPAGTFQSVSAGGAHTCGVKTDGSVECWGRDDKGQATPPSGSFESVSAGGYHTCGVTNDGSVECWGHGGHGRSTPPSGTFESVSAGGWHTCGITSSGAVECWGQVTDAPSDTFQSVSAGGFHNCGITSTGSVVCWGIDDDSTYDYGQSTPPSGTFTAVTGGYSHTCGVKTDGSVECWGRDVEDQSTPPSGTFQSVSAGGVHTCGVTTIDEVKCWGNNDKGQSSPIGTAVSTVVAPSTPATSALAVTDLSDIEEIDAMEEAVGNVLGAEPGREFINGAAVLPTLSMDDLNVKAARMQMKAYQGHQARAVRKRARISGDRCMAKSSEDCLLLARLYLGEAYFVKNNGDEVMLRGVGLPRDEIGHTFLAWACVERTSVHLVPTQLPNGTFLSVQSVRNVDVAYCSEAGRAHLEGTWGQVASKAAARPFFGAACAKSDPSRLDSTDCINALQIPR